MKLRIIAAAAALLLAILGGSLVVAYVNGANARALAGTKTTPVIVVTQPIAAGTPEGALGADLAVKQIPADAIAQGALTALPTGNKVTSTALVPGEQLLASRLVDADSAAAAGATALPKGLQAVTVGIIPERAVGGTVKAGETVGVFFTTGGQTHLDLQKVLVMAVQGAPTATPSSVPSGAPTAAPTATAASPSADATPVSTAPMFITLALSAHDAEKVVWAAQNGTIWLSNEPATADETGTSIVNAASAMQ
ncbi:Flp pilus assembly protein CpaB [Curtobacterium ammoniigenes]|uniref:Flp pilus assembly protein CpaB n=1 Tax=Curtobacterium ammoniigenes TaxID=395387 RepID=UPI00082B2D7B|nr:RcpC/CpaB family pilus assembly protein [Curtobacterium ammoniigenes]